MGVLLFLCFLSGKDLVNIALMQHIKRMKCQSPSVGALSLLYESILTLANCWPITLLNLDYKIASKVTAKIIEKSTDTSN